MIASQKLDAEDGAGLTDCRVWQFAKRSLLVCNHTADQSAFLDVSPEDLPRATFAKAKDSIVEPLMFSPVHFPAQ